MMGIRGCARTGCPQTDAQTLARMRMATSPWLGRSAHALERMHASQYAMLANILAFCDSSEQTCEELGPTFPAFCYSVSSEGLHKAHFVTQTGTDCSMQRFGLQ